MSRERKPKSKRVGKKTNKQIIMKTIFKTTFFMVALGLTLIGCNNNGDISTNGIISGTIADYTAGSVDSIKCFDGDEIIGKCSVASNGKFSMTLAIPFGSQIGNGPGGSVVVSDPTTTMGTGGMVAYKNKTSIGVLIKCNYTHNQSTVNVGDAIVDLIYVNKPCKITGTESDTSYSVVYDLNLVKGWNEVISKVTAYSSTSNSMTLSTTIPSDLKWRYISSSYQVKQFKIPGIKF